MPKLIISEEYGYRYWVADLTDDEFDLLKDSWCSMRGLNCLVPVKLIVPQARQMTEEELLTHKPGMSCHIHECDDSRLVGVDYEIPPDKDFWLDGICYTHDELLEMFRKEQEAK